MIRSVSFRQASVRALLTDRYGGVSLAPFDSLNLALGVGDLESAVLANRKQLLSDLPAEPTWLSQVHSNRVVSGDELQSGVEADGSFTNEAGVVLAVMVADCLPILLAGKRSDEIAVVHAGWRGLHAGVIEAGVSKFAGGEVEAWIGPGIGQCHYEVSHEVFDCFDDRYFVDGRDADHWMFDTRGVALEQLQNAGVKHVNSLDHCTYCDAQYFSYRRDGRTGRFAALIWLER